MRYLFAYLYRKRNFILFLILQLIAFSLIYRHRSYQRSVMMNSANEIVGSILKEYDNYTRYLDLQEQNEKLLRDNARLRSLQKGSYFPITRNSRFRTDTIFEQRYEYVTANVINSSYLKARNFITLDRGSDHGIESEMGVVGPEGVVGIVQHVSKRFCTVIPLINPGIALSGQFKEQGYFGRVVWLNSDYKYITLMDIPAYATIKAGDTVVTDARSLVFPPDLPIGTVVNAELQQDQNFLSVKLKLSTDFAALQQVYIIKDRMKLEVQQLEEQNSEEN